MPHVKCVACRTRLFFADSAPDLVGDLCPLCGSLLEPVGDLSEVVGFRSIKPRGSPADDDPRGADGRPADRGEDLLACRDSRHALAQLDAERWIDEGGSGVDAEAAALPPPEIHP